MANGRFQKISVPTDGRLFGILKAWGSSLNWNSEGIGASLNWNSEGMGGFRSGISRGDRQECVP